MVLSDAEWDAVKALWNSQTCGSLVESQQPIVVEGDMTTEAACEVLVKNNILSAPVRSSQTGQLTGFFTYKILVESLLAKFAVHKHPQELNMADMLHAVGPKAPVDEIVKDQVFSTVGPNEPLEVVVKKFGQREHRSAVVDENSKFHGMISQGGLLQFLESKRSDVQNVMSRSLKDLKMVKGTVVSLPKESLVIEAVQTLIDKNISSIAITNSRNTIIGALSLADVKWILRRRHYHMFWAETEKFLGHVRREEAFTANNMARDSYPVFTIHADRPLSNAVEKLLILRTHRLWIVENDFAPRGVVSITDIMRLLTPP